MPYVSFANADEVSAANGRWLAAREAAGRADVYQGSEVAVTSAWDLGAEQEDGTWICVQPSEFAEEFGGTLIE